MRRDAVENQERLLAAAVTTMLRDGRQVPMAVIAAEAGVGIGTLYRKYPNREALLNALTERAFDLLAGIAADVHARGGTGLAQLGRWYAEDIREHDQLVLPLHGGPVPLSPTAKAAQQRLHAALTRILDTGKADGTIRREIELRDVIFFGAMLVSRVHGQRDWQRIAKRQTQIHLRGLAGPAAGEPSAQGAGKSSR